MSEAQEFGLMVCETLGISPSVVRSIVIEVYPSEVLRVTLEVRAGDSEVLEWARSESLKNADKVVLIELRDAEMV